MKTFHYELGHKAGRTMQVGEIFKEMWKYPAHIPVFIEWEGVRAYVTPDSFSRERMHKGDSKEECWCLVINADEY